MRFKRKQQTKSEGKEEGREEEEEENEETELNRVHKKAKAFV